MSTGTHHKAAGEPEGVALSDEDICIYIAEICAELRTLARSPRFRTINYLLDMARLEAERTAKDMRNRGTRRTGTDR